MAEYRNRVVIGVVLVVFITAVLAIAVNYLPLSNNPNSTSSSNSITQSETRVVSNSNVSFSEISVIQVAPTDIAYDSYNGNVFVVDYLSNSIAVVDGKNNSIIDHIGMMRPSAIFYDSSNRNLYATCSLDTNYSLAVIDGNTNSILKYFPGSCDDGNFALDPVNHHVFVTGYTGNLTVIDDKSNEIVGSLYLGGTPTTITYDSSNREMYVVCAVAGEVKVINTTSLTLVSSIKVESNVPVHSMGLITYDPQHGLIYVTTSMGHNFLWMINDTTNRIVGSIPFIQDGQGYAYDYANGIFYFPRFSNEIVALNASNGQVLGTIRINGGINGVALDSMNNSLFVGNLTSNTVDVITLTIHK